MIIDVPYKVTIGIPVYQVEKYIRESLESVLSQTFPNLEILICDDCGVDSSMDIVREYQQIHPRGKDIHIVRQPQNGGLGRARNRMIAEARGQYIFFMDSDDLLSPNTIELLYSYARKYDADMVYGSMEKVLLFDKGRRIKNIDYAFHIFQSEDEFASWVYKKYDRIQASTCNFLIKLDIYRKNDIKYKPINYWEDFTTTMDLPTYVNRVVLLPDVTYLYMCREGSLSNYQQRDYIRKEEILNTIDAMAEVKQNSERIKTKPYFHKRMYKVMMTHFYMASTIINLSTVISPSFTKLEIRNLMLSPLSFSETLALKGWKFRNLVLYMLGVLPPLISVALIEFLGKTRRLTQFN